jgi:flagellar biosynthetic protein FliR
MSDLPTSDDVFGIVLIFVRVGAALMLMPGFSEPYIFSRSRLLFTLIVSFLLAGPLTPHLPPLPMQLADLALLIFREALFGLFIGGATRIIFAALHVAGSTIAVQSGLATASVFDPNQSTQGTLPGNFLTTVAMVLLFVTDSHHMLLRGIIQSYGHLQANAGLPIGDMASFMTRIVQKGFDIGVQMAAPLLLVGLLTNLAMGVLNRLMPTFQVFFIALPLQLLLSFATLMLSFAAGLLVFFSFLEVEYSILTQGG